MIPHLVDSHCHLDHVDTDAARDEILSRGRAAGIERFVCIGAGHGVQSNQPAVDLAVRHGDVFATVGVHPHDASVADENAIAFVEQLGTHPRVVAIGEVGLDFHYDQSPRDVQLAVLRRFVHVARRVRKPLVIHTRNAPAETLAILAEENARDVGGVIHCFSEDEAFARKALDLDFDISFSGIVTFKKSQMLRDVARVVPRDRIMVETDAPFLAPVPHRGSQNEPAWVEHTVRALAAVLQVSPEDLARFTRENAFRRFALH